MLSQPTGLFLFTLKPSVSLVFLQFLPKPFPFALSAVVTLLCPSLIWNMSLPLEHMLV